VRRYELMLLFRPDLEDDQLQSAVERVTRAIVNSGGSLSKISPWGKRRLAYPIQHHRDASYFLIHFDIEPAAVREIERGLLISEEILRHLVVVLEPRQRREGDGDLEMDGEADVMVVGVVDELAPPPDLGAEDKPEADDEREAVALGDDQADQTDDVELDVNEDVNAPEEVAG
jgi:small subunit ribosomal protein S6